MFYQRQYLPLFGSGARRHGILLPCLPLLCLGWISSQAAAQSVSLEGACPAACGVSLRITGAVVSEASDGVLVKVDWTIGQPKPEIKLTSLAVTARADLGIDQVERTVSVTPDQRSVTIRLSRRLEFDVRDIRSLQVKVSTFVNPLPPVSVTGITSRRIVGSGRDAAVEVTWNDPGPLSCTATKFDVRVSALNEKGDKLTGNFETPLTARRALVGLSGALNRKGLNSPDATVRAVNAALGCNALQNVTPANTQPPVGAGVGSLSPEAAKVTLSRIAFQEDGTGRVDTSADWSVVEPTGFRAAHYDVKFELADTSGRIITQNSRVSGDKRTERGPQGVAAQTRSLTVTVTATFRDNANTNVLTREDKGTQAFSSKQLPTSAVAAKAPTVAARQGPALQPPPVIGLDVTQAGMTSGPTGHQIAAAWSVNVPAGITVASFEIEAHIAGSRGTLARNVTVDGNQRRAALVFSLSEAGSRVGRVQVKVTANCRRADGSTFRQTATRAGS